MNNKNFVISDLNISGPAGIGREFVEGKCQLVINASALVFLYIPFTHELLGLDFGELINLSDKSIIIKKEDIDKIKIIDLEERFGPSEQKIIITYRIQPLKIGTITMDNTSLEFDFKHKHADGKNIYKVLANKGYKDFVTTDWFWVKPAELNLTDIKDNTDNYI